MAVTKKVMKVLSWNLGGVCISTASNLCLKMLHFHARKWEIFTFKRINVGINVWRAPVSESAALLFWIIIFITVDLASTNVLYN